jgi:hypothetical protein
MMYVRRPKRTQTTQSTQGFHRGSHVVPYRFGTLGNGSHGVAILRFLLIYLEW